MFEKDYLFYAVRQLLTSIEKADDAPASSAMHEQQALMALKKGRIPTGQEVLDSFKEEEKDGIE